MLLELNCYRTFLSEELARRIKAHPRYSQRAFARDLKMSAGELSEVLQQKRRLSVRSALKVARYLSLNPTETKHFSISCSSTARKSLAETLERGSWQPMAADDTAGLDRFRLVSDWTCFAILNLAECDGFRPVESWIARRLGISGAQARVALGRLERVGLARKGSGPVAFSQGRLRRARRRAVGVHSRVPRADSGESGAGPRASARARARVRRSWVRGRPQAAPRDETRREPLLDEMVAKYAKGKNRTEVYQMEMALFRLTEGDSNAN